MDVASLTAKILKKQGVKYVFGIPGGPSIPYMESWRAEGIPFILTSHEYAAGIMADVTSRVTSTPGVCHSTFGPGATNMATGVGCATLDRSPVIALTTEVADVMRYRTTQMNIDHQKLFAPITKDTIRLSAATLTQQLTTAFDVAETELPGAVHAGLPADIYSKEGSEVFNAEEYDAVPRGGSEAIHREGDIAKLLKSARRPVIAVGLTAARYGTGNELLRFLSRASVPVVLTPMAKGIVPSSHPCYCGVLFHALSDRLRRVTCDADLVIGLGYDPVEYNYEAWMPEGASLVHFGTTPVDMPPGITYAAVAGRPESWFCTLDDYFPDGDYIAGRGVEEVRNEIQGVFDGCASKWGPVSVLQILKESMPDDVILTCDVGSHLHTIGQFWSSERYGRLVMTNGWSSMGFGIPAALAISLNRPDTTVLCVVGDGGFLMSAGEIMTARRYGLTIKVVVISDNELNLIKVKQAWRETSAYGTNLLDGDLFCADTFLGVPVLNAGSDISLRDAIGKALLINGTVIINAVVPGDDYHNLIVRT